MTLLEQVIEVMAENRGAAHVADIALILTKRYPNIQIPADKLPDKLANLLSSDVRKTGGKAKFGKVKNKTGGFKRGVYRLKSQPVVTPKPTVAPTVTSQYTGKAGESAVISELLFYGFNASAMAVDDGIDVVASKESKYFHIQVKTSNSSDQGVFGFTIKKSSFVAKDSFQTFYILVIRDKDKHRYINDYVILTSHQIRQLVEVGVVADGASFSLRVHRDARGRFILNGKQDVTISVNTFSQLG
jgi:hypothetical protein